MKIVIMFSALIMVIVSTYRYLKDDITAGQHWSIVFMTVVAACMACMGADNIHL